MAYFPGSTGRQTGQRVLLAQVRSRERWSRLLRQATWKKICVRSKSTHRLAGRYQRQGFLRTLNKQHISDPATHAPYIPSPRSFSGLSSANDRAGAAFTVGLARSEIWRLPMHDQCTLGVHLRKKSPSNNC